MLDGAEVGSASTPEAATGLRTDEGGDLGVDDAAGKEVKVVLHRVHHHRVSRVVAALQRRSQDTGQREKQGEERTSRSSRHCPGPRPDLDAAHFHSELRFRLGEGYFWPFLLA